MTTRRWVPVTALYEGCQDCDHGKRCKCGHMPDCNCPALWNGRPVRMDGDKPLRWAEDRHDG